jgi:hypothetical protein
MNIGFLLYPFGDHRISEFEDNSDRVNAIADRSKGFVWRLKDEGFELPENDIGGLIGRPDVAAATLSVWESYENFEQFVHKTVHNQFLRRRAEWFENINAPSYVIWPVEAGHIPSLIEGYKKLMLLREHGPSEEAYNFEFKLIGSTNL